jgi:hypothetical protein
MIECGVGVRMPLHRGEHRDPRAGYAEFGAAEKLFVVEGRRHRWGVSLIFLNDSRRRVLRVVASSARSCYPTALRVRAYSRLTSLCSTEDCGFAPVTTALKLTSTWPTEQATAST